MKLVESRFQAVPLNGERMAEGLRHPGGGSRIADLAAALKKAKVPRRDRRESAAPTRLRATKLSEFLADTEAWDNSRAWVGTRRVDTAASRSCRSRRFPDIEVPAGLPGEFADYLEGALAWHNPALIGKGMACGAWERLLARPPQERRFKSTWAAFMLGKAWEEDEPDKAVAILQASPRPGPARLC